MAKSFVKLVMIQESIDKIESMGFQKKIERSSIYFYNQYGYIDIYKSTHYKNLIYLQCSFLDAYGISRAEIGYKREWYQSEENIKEIYEYIISTLLPIVSKLKGPQNVKRKEYYEIIIKIMKEHKYKKLSEGRKEFTIPELLKNYVMNKLSEISTKKEVDYVEFLLDEYSKVYFTINDDIDHGLIFSFKDQFWFYPWYKFASGYAEDNKCITEMVETFLANWKSLINAPVPVLNPDPSSTVVGIQWYPVT